MNLENGERLYPIPGVRLPMLGNGEKMSSQRVRLRRFVGRGIERRTIIEELEIIEPVTFSHLEEDCMRHLEVVRAPRG